MLELVVLLLISTWQKGLLKGPDSPGAPGPIEEPLEPKEKEDMTPTLDQVAAVETEIDVGR